MSHSYTQTHVHLVFSTKERQKLIVKELQPRLWAYVAAICKNQNMPALAVGGISDHMHILFRLPPTSTLVRAVTLIKSTRQMGSRERRNFSWQGGYGAFNVSASNVDTVVKYIDNQEAHHRKFAFEQEFITLLKKHGIPFDPQHVFD